MLLRILSLVPNFFYEMYSYREYLIQSVQRDLKNKYKRSVLGYLWTMVHPLAMMTVLAVVFSHIMNFPTKDYAVFLFSALLPWNYFNSTSMMSLGTIRANARLFSQIPVPKFIFVLSIAFSNLANLLFALIPLFIIMIATGKEISFTALFFPIAFIPLFLVVVGVSLVFAASNIFFDDTLHLAEVGMSMLYFLSPILYDRTKLPEDLIRWLELNPIFYQIETFRGIFYAGNLPELVPYLQNLGISLLVLIFGLAIFKKAEDRFLYFI